MRTLIIISILLTFTQIVQGEQQQIVFGLEYENTDTKQTNIPEGSYNDKSQILTIQLTSSNGYFVLITDSAGDIVLREPLKTDGSRNSISLTSLDNGLYFVFLESTTNRFIGKIFID